MGEISVQPFDESWVRAAGILLHLGEKLLKTQVGIDVDVKNGIVPGFDEIIITEEKPYRLMPGEFILGATFQSVTVGARFGCLIEGRSTLARVGLTIVQTAMLVYPGHRDRPITLELANHGPNPILLYPRMKIARVALIELRTPAKELYDDAGKYRIQKEVGGPIFKNEVL